MGGSSIGQFLYDDVGQRLRTQYNTLENGKATTQTHAQHSLYQGLKLISQYDISASNNTDLSISANYQFAGGMNIGRRAYNEDDSENNTQTYYHTDALGSVLATSKANKSIAARYDYDAWGKELNNTDTSNNPIGYTGHQMDRESENKTGLIYANARYLDPDTGRFLSFDPFAGYDDKPISLNKYLYAYQNPVRYTDPTGNVPVLDEAGQGLSDIGDSLIDQAANTDSTAEAIAYGVGAGANYFVSGIVETVNFGLNIAGSQGWLGDGVQNRATSELHEAFDTIQTLVEDPKGTASAVVSNIKSTATAAAAGDTRSIAQVAAAATSLLGAKPNVSVAAAAKAVASTAKNIVVGTGTVLRNTARQIAKNASQPSRGQMFGQRGAVGNLSTKTVVKASEATNKTGKKYVTYTANDLDNPGKIYTGRCSGSCDMTPKQILDKRKAGHHRNLGNLQLDKVTDSYAAIRGREQQVIESLRKQGLASDQINGVGPRNKKKNIYMNAANKAYGE